MSLMCAFLDTYEYDESSIQDNQFVMLDYYYTGIKNAHIGARPIMDASEWKKSHIHTIISYSFIMCAYIIILNLHRKQQMFLTNILK